jgi:hypothetical protein
VAPLVFTRPLGLLAQLRAFSRASATIFTPTDTVDKPARRRMLNKAPVSQRINSSRMPGDDPTLIQPIALAAWLRPNKTKLVDQFLVIRGWN